MSSISYQPPGPVCPAVQSVCKPIFPLCPEKTAIGDSVRNPAKVLLYSPSVWSVIASSWMQLLERILRGYSMWSFQELRWHWPLLSSFLKMGIMLSFSQSSSGAFYSPGFPHMIDSSLLVTLVTLSVPSGESHPGMHLSISRFFCVSLNCCFCGLMSLLFWNGAGIWLCWKRLRWRLCWCFASCYVYCLFLFLSINRCEFFMNSVSQLTFL